MLPRNVLGPLEADFLLENGWERSTTPAYPTLWHHPTNQLVDVEGEEAVKLTFEWAESKD